MVLRLRYVSHHHGACKIVMYKHSSKHSHESKKLWVLIYVVGVSTKDPLEFRECLDGWHGNVSCYSNGDARTGIQKVDKGQLRSQKGGNQ